MKKALLFAGSVVLLGACTEKGFEITPRTEGGDTTFLATTEAPQSRTVMVEEFTGVTCPNCPDGHTRVAAMQAQFPGRVLAVSLYYNGLGQTRPVENLTREDFRNADATSLGDAIFGGVPGLPCAGIDRMPVNGIALPAKNVWEGAVTARLGVASPANMQVTSEWNDGDRTAIIRVRVAYTSAVAKKQSLTLMLTEDGLVDAQEYPDRIDTFYSFKHVLRDVITAPSGEAMLDEFETKEPGRVYERTFVYQVPASWQADKCKLIAFVHNAGSGDKEVLQASEAKLIE